MAIPEGWYYAGAGAAGLAAGALLYHALAPDPELVYTGLGREYTGEKGGDVVMAASVWAIPGRGYVPRFDRVPGLEEMKLPIEYPIFEWHYTAALWADDIMDRLGYKPAGPWGGSVMEVVEVREKEKGAKPAVGARRRGR
jgi:hypothetical protein